MYADMAVNDAANQILNYTRYLWCPEKQIYYHCYHTDNKEHGVAHWSRANGWIFMATADLLARMPKNHPMREDVIKNFQMQASGVARYQGKNGLWHQLLDKEDSGGLLFFESGWTEYLCNTWSCVESGKAADAESRGYSAERTHTYTGM